ncbi:hypothetical protein HID58_020494 [Brassica napus]|uniref:DNA-directed RNA polymerase n=1 Tax=Brassica napus TaxID=3708 RepID=A0ABQ7XD08_BRANA|nr:hypothetical protein HID58_090336 [Brassica napus]KAH0853836.1 hypothetical protein HID58_092824 [Brassica napus]KAH0853863.1 hypothetical protein HID58_092821 [Brassica napus]KAH0855105.1 hypothetical protein HID58_020494 [Brassica napus]
MKLCKTDTILISSTIIQHGLNIGTDETSDPIIDHASPTGKHGDMGDPRVQSRKLGVELKVHELKWINYGHFTRPRSHEEELGRARSSLERANLKDYQYFMTIDPFVHKSPSDRYLIHLMISPSYLVVPFDQLIIKGAF